LIDLWIINYLINQIFNFADSETEEEWQVRQEPTARYTIPRKADSAEVSTWDLALSIWPLEDRPETMTRPAVVNAMTLQNLFAFKEHYELLQKKEGKGESTFGSDRKLPAKRFPEQEDDANTALHSMRFERGPVGRYQTIGT